ncbi:putative TetR family transcriptional regulator [Gordonia effusa NBRC 100432]|uniref:Putative TetR family transcriptional regulator n=1 Tax=Gordonia effusa NBRC 100432 TaxID=1077974 RepID=H0R179_9ACTN|nr:TetR/AcrR family transcriptional regulator [Gordonia effusa]GAB18830.1 putative TetR family transcriptional regulator [Gordonia effusa NBRC 100432]
MSPTQSPTQPEGSALRAYGGEGGDKRVARRRAALIDSALESLGGAGGGAITVRGVCKAAGLTARYFYESFDSVDQLVAETFDGVIAEITDGAVAAFAEGVSNQDKVRRSVAAIVDVINGDHRKGRLLFSQKLLSPTLAQRRLDSTEAFALLTVESAGAFDVDANPSVIAGAHFLVGGFARTLAAWLDGHIDLTVEEMVDVCTEMLLGGRRTQ